MKVVDLVAWGKLIWKACRASVLPILAYRHKQLHLFILKAVTANPYARPQPGEKLSIQRIGERIKSAQIDYEVGDLTIGQRMGWNYITRQQRKTAADRAGWLRSLGLPDRKGPRYEAEIEEILQQMVDAGKLNYHPPDCYSIR